MSKASEEQFTQLAHRVANSSRKACPLDLRGLKLAGLDLRSLAHSLHSLKGIEILLSEDTLKGSILNLEVIRALKPSIIKCQTSLADCTIIGPVIGRRINDPAFGHQIIHYINLDGIDFKNAVFKGPVAYVSFVGADLTNTKFEQGLQNCRMRAEPNRTSGTFISRHSQQVVKLLQHILFRPEEDNAKRDHVSMLTQTSPKKPNISI